jgi:hypothetical protein
MTGSQKVEEKSKVGSILWFGMGMSRAHAVDYFTISHWRIKHVLAVYLHDTN